ncbi:lytic transglycosylase domain-containing protein [Streptomyces sp. NPDC058086]|uniref:lytic transglycosylase domain-containing protein n=1 Tax=Streptomyces sp. NPDC058086 TaxID=3346334 RepID=UPI0036EAC2BA
MIIIVGGFGVLLAPLIAIIMLFKGGEGPDVDPNNVASVFQGDGKGTLDPTAVPADLVDPIQEAGTLCPEIGPVVIAAQIDRESGFDANLVGPDGEQGISQLSPEIFARFGKDENDDGKASALDPADAILAQGRYLCSLAQQVRPFATSGQPPQDQLSITLAAYDVGIDAVQAAQGVPMTNRSQAYVLGIRAQFATYEGIVPKPSPSPSGSTNTSGQ